MVENPSVTNEDKIDFTRRQFDGIKFMWQTLETRYLLKLMSFLFVSMIIYFGTTFILILILGEIPIMGTFSFGDFLGFLSFLAEPIFLGSFLFILIELVRLYWNHRNHEFFPERNPLLKMKYWPSPKSKGYIKHPFRLIELGILIAISYLVEFLFYLEILLIFMSLFIFIIFITSFITAKGSMRSFEDIYKEKFEQQRKWFFVFFLVPWAVLFFLFFFGIDLMDFTGPLGMIILLWLFLGFLLYGLLAVLGLIVLINRNWWVGYTASQISASLTFLFVIIVPYLIALVFDLLGFYLLDPLVGSEVVSLIISFIVLAFLFIQGILDGYGDELRDYYTAWDKKLQQFNIKSEEEMLNRPEAFDTTPLPTKAPKSFPNLILGLILFLITFFGILIVILPNFPILGGQTGISTIETFLSLSSIFEGLGLTLALIIFTFIIVFRKQKKFPESQKSERPGQQQNICPKCGAPNAGSKFCTNCGQQL